MLSLTRPGQAKPGQAKPGQARNLVALELLDLLVLRDPLGGGGGPPSPLDLLDLIDLGLAKFANVGPESSKLIVIDMVRPGPKEIFNKSGRPARCADPAGGGGGPPPPPLDLLDLV